MPEEILIDKKIGDTPDNVSVLFSKQILLWFDIMHCLRPQINVTRKPHFHHLLDGWYKRGQKSLFISNNKNDGISVYSRLDKKY